MPRLLAIDFGERRIGLATSDATGSLVTARKVLSRRNDEAAADEIVRFCRDEEIEGVVLGVPRSPEGIESPFAGRVRSFGRKLERQIGLPVVYHEETLTSWEAERQDNPGPGSRDDEAAAVLLRDYLTVGEHRPR
jgi:putative Holliday junction resolvase